MPDEKILFRPVGLVVAGAQILISEYTPHLSPRMGSLLPAPG